MKHGGQFKAELVGESAAAIAGWHDRLGQSMKIDGASTGFSGPILDASAGENPTKRLLGLV